jgi:hypothetical protein
MKAVNDNNFKQSATCLNNLYNFFAKSNNINALKLMDMVFDYCVLYFHVKPAIYIAFEFSNLITIKYLLSIYAKSVPDIIDNDYINIDELMKISDKNKDANEIKTFASSLKICQQSFFGILNQLQGSVDYSDIDPNLSPTDVYVALKIIDLTREYL